MSLFNNDPHKISIEPANGYRADIDGLRALAVLAVVGYHAFPFRFAGGFVGVDIFFVISGYLISSLLFLGLERKTFRFKEFYRRRIRRIFPALIPILMVVLVFGWFTLFGDEYKQLGKHVLGGATFLSNFFLMSEAGYFDNSAATKPLLHLWSLAIEEQFYIFWPLLIAALWKRKGSLLSALTLITLLSFSYHLHLSAKDPSLAFYSPLSRFWELAIGAVLGYFHFFKHELSPPLRKGATSLGILAIFVSIWFVPKSESLSGWFRLAPTLGAACLIAAGPNTWINKKLLSQKFLVWFGLISYPLYLWHWPLLSFAHIVVNANLSTELRLGLILISILLAALTYEFIEKPIRLGQPRFGKSVILMAALSLAGCFGYFIFFQNGLKFRSAEILANAKQLDWHSFKSEGCNSLLGAESAFCIIYGNSNNIKVAVIGDSTANALGPGIAELYATDKVGVINIGNSTCPIIRGFAEHARWFNNENEICQHMTEKAYALILNSKTIKIVYLSLFPRDLQFWVLPGLPPDASLTEKFALVKELLNKDIADLQKRGIQLVVSYDSPYLPIEPRQCLNRLGRKSLESCVVEESRLIDRQPYLDFFEKYFSEQDQLTILRLSDLLLRERKIYPFDRTGQLLLRDDHHLSYYGSTKAAAQLGALLPMTQ